MTKHYAIIKTSPYPKIYVYGAGSLPVEGAYSYSEMFNGKPKYVQDYDSSFEIFWNELDLGMGEVYYWWTLYDNINQISLYNCYDDVPTPILCGDWDNEEGSTPSPRIWAEVPLSISGDVTGVPLDNYIDISLGEYTSITINGEYKIYVLAGTSGLLTIDYAGYTFSPPNYEIIDISENILNMNFIGQPIPQ